MIPATDPDRQAGAAAGLRRIVAVVAAANLTYFFVEYWVAARIGSVALFADSVDFLEDASINILVLLALGWSAARRRIVGMVLAGFLLVPGIAALWTAYDKLAAPTVPEPTALTLTGAGAFAVNLCCTMLLARTQSAGGALTRAAFLSARNDVVANVAIVGAGLATFALGSVWPDLLVGLGIAAMNATSAYEVFEAATGADDDDDEGANPSAPRP